MNKDRLIHYENMVKLNKESIAIQETRPDKGISEYLKGQNSVYEIMIKELTEETLTEQPPLKGSPAIKDSAR